MLWDLTLPQKERLQTTSDTMETSLSNSSPGRFWVCPDCTEENSLDNGRCDMIVEDLLDDKALLSEKKRSCAG